MSRVLVIEDELLIRQNVIELLDAEGYEVVGAGDGKTGIAAALAHRPEVIVCDISMPAMDGYEVLRAIRSYPETECVPFIFLTARANRPEIRKGMRLGADDYVTKPFSRAELLDSISSRLERYRALMGRAVEQRRGASTPSGGPVAVSEAMRTVFDKARRAGKTPLNVLLLGETGVGKDVLAREIHRASDRAEGPFVPLNCAALPESLVESELFGYEKGAFTGAGAAREGLFESANGGTVFLDEVGDLPLAAQAKLLRVLQDKAVTRLGAREARPVNVRFISATNRTLDGAGTLGDFRQDLFFRIAGVILHVPPLRERVADIRPLALRFAEQMLQQLPEGPRRELDEEALATLESYPWPGNVRELRNVVEEAVALGESPVIGASAFPDRVRDPRTTAHTSASVEEARALLVLAEARRIAETLERCGGNQTRAAVQLGISRRTLVNRLDELGLPRPRKR